MEKKNSTRVDRVDNSRHTKEVRSRCERGSMMLRILGGMGESRVVH